MARHARAALLRHFSVRSHIISLILVIVAPLLAFSAFLVLHSAASEQEIMAADVRARTREAVAAIDHELGALRSRLFTLASSRHLQAEDFVGFAHAIEALKAEGLGVVLSDSNGRELIDTSTPPGEPLGMAADPASIRRVVETLQPDVADFARDTVTGAPTVAVSVPVPGNGRPTYVLTFNIAPLLPRMLTELNLPPDWLVTIGDRAGTTIARSRDAERFVGQMGRPAALEHLRASDEGWFPLTSREGIPLYIAFAHVRFSGWSVAIGIPDRVLFAPVRRSTWILILAGGVVLALALLLATAIGQRIAGAITGLAGYAEAVGRGESIGLPHTGLQEADAVAHSLHLASERLQQSARERAMLLDRTVTAQEAERRRIARELHDSLGQYLTALRLGFGAIEPHCANNESAQQRLRHLKTLAADLGRELNRMAWELRPMALDDLGLQRAVTQYLEEWADRSRLHIDLEIHLDDRRLPQPVETALFRVLQEAITNVAKHSCADRVSVILGAAGREVCLIVEDDGKGFEVPGGVEGHELGVQHLGLRGVRERLAVVGGILEVESSVTGGTTVFVRIPL